MRLISAVLICGCLPAPGVAHPHVYIDTGLELILNETGHLTHVRVTWAYDDLYSLFVLEDERLDSDGDGILTSDEEQRLAGFDAQWVEGYDGDLMIQSADGKVVLSGPMEPTATTENGRIVTSHLRAVEGVLQPVEGLSIKAYDPSFYTAYELTRPVIVTGASSCDVTRFEPDIEGKLAEMRDFLLTLDANYDLEENDIPLVGGEFATEIRVACPAS